MATEVVALKAGRPAVPKNSLEEVLNRYVQYDTNLRFGPNRQAHRPRGPFLELMGRSDQWLRNYLKNQHLTWETLQSAVDDDLLFFVTFGQRPYDCTWASASTHRALGYTFEEQHERLDDGRTVFAGYASELLSGKPAIEMMNGGRPWSERIQQEIDKVRADPTYVGHIARTSLVRCTDGWRVPIEIVELRYTNEWVERWVTIARIIGEPHPSTRALRGRADGRATTHGMIEAKGQVSNVDLTSGVLRLTRHDPSTITVNPDKPLLSLYVGPPSDQTRLFVGTQEEWTKLYVDSLPPYRPPTDDDSK